MRVEYPKRPNLGRINQLNNFYMINKQLRELIENGCNIIALGKEDNICPHSQNLYKILAISEDGIEEEFTYFNESPRDEAFFMALDYFNLDEL